MKTAFALLSLTLLAAGCGATMDQLVRRASFDLNCPEQQIEVYEIDGRTRGVRGCSRQAVYIESCANPQNRTDCTWVLNADPGQTGAPAPTPAPAAAPEPAPAPAVTTEDDGSGQPPVVGNPQ